MAADYDTTTGLRALKGDSLVSDIDAGFLALATDTVAYAGPRGHSNIATSETTTSTSYTTLTTPDRVQSVVVPSNALVEIDFYALWKHTGSGRASVFIGANQLKVAVHGTAAAQTQAARGDVNAFSPLHTCRYGLIGPNDSGGDYTFNDMTNATTGQAVASLFPNVTAATSGWAMDIGGTVWPEGGPSVPGQASPQAGSLRLFLDAGTYDFSVQFKVITGTLTAKNRQLWVRVLPY